MAKRKSLFAVLWAFCLTIICAIVALLPNTAQKVDAAETPTTGAHTVTDVFIHHLASSGNGVFCYFKENGTTLMHDLSNGLNEDNNTYLKNFANQLGFNGGRFETDGVGGRLNTQGSLQNWYIEKMNGATPTAIASGDYFLIPQGAMLQTGSVTFTFGKSFKIMYTGSTTCPQTSNGVTCGGAGKCYHGFHVFSWSVTSVGIDQISLHQTAGGKDSAYLQFWSGSNIVDSQFAQGENVDNNANINAFAQQLLFNGGSFVGNGQIVGQGNINLNFKKADGSQFKEGEEIYIPYGTRLETPSAIWTFNYNFKIVASSKTCSETANCVSTPGSQYCREGYFQVYRWGPNDAQPEVGVPVLKTHADNTAVTISAMTKTDGTVGKVPYFYVTQGYALSFDLLDHYGAGFGLVIGNQADINAFNNNYNYWLFKKDGTTVNTLGYTGTFSYTIGNSYKFAVESGKINLYEKSVLEDDTQYEKVATANFTLSSWNSIGVYALSDDTRSATAVVDNLAVYNQSGSITVFANCDGALPSGWGANNSNGKGTVEIYNQIMYQVSFLDEKGNLVSTQNVCANGKAIAPEQAPVIDGYEFTGWSDDYSVITSSVAIFPTYKSLTEDEPVNPPQDSSGDSASDSDEDITSDSSVGSSEEDITSDSSVGSSEEDITSDSSVGSSEEDIASDSSVGSSEEDITSDSSVGSSEEDIASDSSINNSMDDVTSTDNSQNVPQNSEGANSSGLSIGGCASSMGILPILTLLGVGLYIKKRGER